MVIERLIYRYVMSSCIKFDNEVLCYFFFFAIFFFFGVGEEGEERVGWLGGSW